MNVTISLELVETLLEEGTFTGSVLLLEIKESMEHSISAGLVGGRVVSLREAFKQAWGELVEEMSDFDDSS